MPASPHGGPTRVLVVDDEDAARGAVAAGLRAAGYVVAEAADGTAGLAAALGSEVDLIVLDLRLPGMEGEEVLAALRRTHDTPVIVVSSKRDEDDRVAALDLGADDYLVKPFTVRELVARIRAVLRRSDGEVAAGATVGDVTIDFPSRCVSRGGERVALTAQEFAVLECLVRHRGRIVSRAALEATIHPGETPPEETVSNVVDVVVLRLRRKLGRDLITTRRGQGFLVESGDR